MTGSAPGGPGRAAGHGPLVCAAKGCRADAVSAVLWNNPALHAPARRKVWLACPEHEESLRAFLAVRGFHRQTIPVADLDETHG